MVYGIVCNFPMTLSNLQGHSSFANIAISRRDPNVLPLPLPRSVRYDS